MGAESETQAWTAYAGRWRAVHIRYPQRFPPGWGRGPFAAIALALLGGNFVPISQAPALLRKLTLLTPNGWALRAFTDLGTGARSLSTVATAILVCLAFAAVTGGIGLARATTVLAE